MFQRPYQQSRCFFVGEFESESIDADDLPCMPIDQYKRAVQKTSSFDPFLDDFSEYSLFSFQAIFLLVVSDGAMENGTTTYKPFPEVSQRRSISF